MSYILSVSDTSCTYTGTGLRKVSQHDVDLYVTEESEIDPLDIIDAYHQQKLHAFLNEEVDEQFTCFIYDKRDSTFFIYNDHYGSADVLCTVNHGNLYASNSAKLLFHTIGAKPKFRSFSVYELIVFQAIEAPHTIYESVYTVPVASSLVFRGGSISFVPYWDLIRRLGAKERDYDTLVSRIQKAMSKRIASYDPNTTSIALSGGVDSGGLLGMATSIHKQPLQSITIGGHGSTSFDLTSSRQSAAYNNSQNHEYYPQVNDLSKLSCYLSDLNQPICANVAFPYGYIQEHAKTLGTNGVMYGFGAEMTLGNLLISKLAFLLVPVERLIPRRILTPIYSWVGKWMKLSKTQMQFLLSSTWTERFTYARGPLYTWEQKYFTKDKGNFWNSIVKQVEKRAEVWKGLPVIDSIVAMYITSWVSYQQLRDLSALGRKFGVRPLLPFNTPSVAYAFFATPTKFRRKNRWKKQVIRDVFRPYISDRLYNNAGRSLIIPYSNLFKGKEEKVFRYLKNSPIVRDLFDVETFERDFTSRPEQGLFLFRMLGPALWYDMNWGEGPKAFEQILT